MLLAVLSVAMACLGCTGKPKQTEDEVTTDFRHISRAYQVIQAGSNRPPRDVAEIEKILGELHKDGLNDKPEEVLTSSRDGQRYVIIMGATLGASTSNDILAYEKTGVDGNRYVLLTSSDVRQIPDAEFRQSTFAKGHKPEPK